MKEILTKRGKIFILILSLLSLFYILEDFHFPFSVSIPFIAVQLSVFASYLMLKKEGDPRALFILLVNFLYLFTSSKLCFGEWWPNILRSEFHSFPEYLFLFLWSFLFGTLLIGWLFYVSRRIEERQRIAALLIAAATVVFMNSRFLKKEPFPLHIRDDAVYVAATPLCPSPGGRIYFNRKLVDRAYHRDREFILLFNRKKMLELKRETLAEVGRLVLKKDFIFLKAGNRKVPLFFPWHLLELLALPLAAAGAALARRVKIPFPLLLVLLAALFYIQGWHYFHYKGWGFIYYDTDEYITRADSLLRGFSFGEELGLGGEGCCYWPPLPIYFLALFFFLFGKAWNTLLLFHTLLFLLELLLLRGIAESLGIPSIPAVLLFALSGYTIYLINPESEPLFTFLFILAFYFLVKPATLSAALSGFFFGLSSLARSFTLFLPALLALFMPRRKGLILFLAATITVLPWIVRCYCKCGRFVPISSAGAEVFFRGNSPFSTGGRMLNLVASERAFREMGYDPNKPLDVIRYNLKHPDNFLRLVPRKLYWLYWADPKRYLDLPPKTVGFSFLFLKSHTPLSEAGKLFLWLFVLRGIILALKERNPLWRPVCITLAYHAASFLAFLGQPRYTAPVSFIIFILAVRGGLD